MKLSEAIEALAIATRADGRSTRTVESYREKLGHLTAFLGDMEVAEIGTDDLRAYVAGMHDSDLSPFTVASRVTALKRLFNWLAAEGYIEHNPASKIKTPKPKREEPKGIGWTDFLALLRTTEGGTDIDKRDRALMLFLYDTGCRVGGLCGLALEDLDLEHRRAVVNEKGGKVRAVFFMAQTTTALREWLEVRPDDRGEWLFTSYKGKSDRLTPRGVSQMLIRRTKAAGVSGPTNPHAFRHGFARAYLMSGGDLGTLSKLLGHSDVGVTVAFYGVFTADEMQRQHAKHSPLAKLEGCTDEERRYNDS